VLLDKKAYNTERRGGVRLVEKCFTLNEVRKKNGWLKYNLITVRREILIYGATHRAGGPSDKLIF
jgi:hypothetical protein